jgi:hypothetical protein
MRDVSPRYPELARFMRMRSEYSIHFVRLGGRVAYRRKDLDQFIEDRVVSSVQDERRIP